jgi:hypothetical protein
VSPSLDPGPIITAAIYVQTLPALAYLVSRARTFPAAFIALGGLVTVLSTMIGVEVGRRLGNNMIVGYITIPFTAGAYILALAEWQVTYVERLTVRIGVALFITIYTLLVIFLENVAHFGQYSHTLYALVLLATALWTLGRRALTANSSTEPLAIETDWFWVAFGLAIYGAATAVSAAIGNILIVRNRVDLFDRAWNVRGALVILAFIAIAWGVFRGPCREPATTNGGSIA